MKASTTMTRRGFLGAAAAIGLGGVAARAGVVDAGDTGADVAGWSIGCYTRPWAEHDYRVALDAIAEAGYAYAGLMSARGGTSRLLITPEMSVEAAARIGDDVRARGLRTLSVYGQFDAGGTRAEAAGRLRRLVANCAACGSPGLLLGGTTDPAQYGPYYEAIAACCDEAASLGVGLTIKPHGGQNATGPQCRRAIERVGHPNFRLWYDPGNIYYYSDGVLDPAEDAAAVDGLVVGMSVKDFRAPKSVDLTPGTGRVDFATVLARLKRGGFRAGPLVVECLAPGDRAATLAEARKALRFVRELTGSVS